MWLINQTKVILSDKAIVDICRAANRMWLDRVCVAEHSTDFKIYLTTFEGVDAFLYDVRSGKITCF